MARKTNQKKFFERRFQKINEIITRLEGEVERAVGQFLKRSEKSSQVLRKNFDEIIDRLGATEIYSRASERTEDLTKELRRVADDVVARVKNFDLKSANGLLEEVRGNLNQVVEKFQTLELLDLVRERAITTRNQVFNVLRIPTQEEVRELNRKLQSLEKKVKTLSRTTNKVAA